MIKSSTVRHDEIMGIVKVNEYESSTLSHSLYLPDSKGLFVTFKSGTTYHYAGVDEKTYTEFVASESHGSALNKLIKGKFESNKVEE